MQINLDHKHLVGYGLAIVLALGLVYSFESNRADRAESKADAAVATAQLLQQQNKDFQASVQAQLNSLAQANVSLSNALAAQKKKDAELSPTELGNRLALLAGVKAEEVQPTSTGFALTTNAVLQSALKLEEVPVLTEQLANQTKSLDLEKQAHVKDNETCKATTDALQLEVKAAKADARKGKLKWFGIGYVAGFVSAHILHF